LKPVTIAALLMFASAPALAQPAPAAPAIPAPEAPAAVTKASTATPNASDLLFEQPQMKNVAPGSTLTYAYLRRSGISKASSPTTPPTTATSGSRCSRAPTAFRRARSRTCRAIR
jgi:hypothetical protein